MYRVTIHTEGFTDDKVKRVMYKTEDATFTAVDRLSDLADKIAHDRLEEFSDGYHTFKELYDYRMTFNALLFNEWSKQNKYSVHKSWRHDDGKLCFDGGWFVVKAETPEGQVSNHYEEKYWDLFNVEERDVASKFDGHTPQQALERMMKLAKM